MPKRNDQRTDSDWEHFAQTDPYWAVLTCDQFRRGNLDAGTRGAFFESGEEHIEWVERTLRAHLDPNFTPRRAIDFGCGVGRLLLPLARRCAEVVGVDVSDTMLREAATNCHAAGADNVTLVKGDDSLSSVSGRFDLVHTLMVLQHIPVGRGVRIFRRLVDLVGPGGCGVLHVTYGPPRQQVKSGLRAFAGALVRPFRSRPSDEPKMQMNLYSLNELVQIVQEAGAPTIHAAYINQAGHYSVVLLFRKGE